jgi:hypothetical protein
MRLVSSVFGVLTFALYGMPGLGGNDSDGGVIGDEKVVYEKACVEVGVWLKRERPLFVKGAVP